MIDVAADTPSPTLAWVRYEVAVSILSQVLAELEKAHVDALAVKGIVLASLLYRDPAERPLRDIDLRVRPRDHRLAARVVRRKGWPMDFTSRQLGAFGFTVGPMLVEIEVSVGPPGLCGLTVERMLERSHVRPVGTARPREPDVVDHAIVLVINAFKDKLVLCPEWSVRDLGTIVEHPEFDADVFLARVRESRIRTITWITADWMASRSPAWRDLRDRIAPSASQRRYAALLERSWRRNPEGLAARLLARIGSDAGGSSAYALAAGVVGSAASWARRRSPGRPR